MIKFRQNLETKQRDSIEEKLHYLYLLAVLIFCNKNECKIDTPAYCNMNITIIKKTVKGAVEFLQTNQRVNHPITLSQILPVTL